MLIFLYFHIWSHIGAYRNCFAKPEVKLEVHFCFALLYSLCINYYLLLLVFMPQYSFTSSFVDVFRNDLIITTLVSSTCFFASAEVREWTQWSEGSCSASCGTGTRTRTRSCVVRIPGAKCYGNDDRSTCDDFDVRGSTEQVSCFERECPTCGQFPFLGGVTCRKETS